MKFLLIPLALIWLACLVFVAWLTSDQPLNRSTRLGRK